MHGRHFHSYLTSLFLNTDLHPQKSRKILRIYDCQNDNGACHQALRYQISQ